MGVSQFKIYRGIDPESPGFINGISGSLITILDACLVNGYGTGPNYKAPAGWLQPLPTISSSIACYQQPSGSGFTLFVNDYAPATGSQTGSLGKEAWVRGYEQLASLTSSNALDLSGSSGSGVYPFPADYSVSLTFGGMLIVRKSNSATSDPRDWILFADERTFYLYIWTGDGYWYPFWFGDMYSYKADDHYPCIICGRRRVNLGGTHNGGDTYYTFCDCFDTVVGWTPAANLQPGLFLARLNNLPGALGIGKLYNFNVCSPHTFVGSYSVVYRFGYRMDGNIPFPNTSDNAVYLCPIQFTYAAGARVGQTFLLGTARGIYQLMHNSTFFTDGQIISGSGDYSGRQFMIIKPIGVVATTAYAMEISNTVEYR